ncbi:hypothetical protein B5807_05245 [Epicoccum nigrum]|uniref:Uncharacterized protein n=1 Tax=Epicoccum nigrum TaxID=105696 RepID=A0A1Y2M1Z0_EPING|nr:hypothetical protein B5807_05245 [Epicoccum nigrum]
MHLPLSELLALLSQTPQFTNGAPITPDVCAGQEYRCAPTLDKVEACHPTAGWQTMCNDYGDCRSLICSMKWCAGVDMRNIACPRIDKEMRKRGFHWGIDMDEYFEPNGVTTTESGSSTEEEGGGAGT